MFGRKYPWIVLSSSLLSVIFLLVGEARFSALSAMRGWYFGSAWIMWSIAPGAFFIGIWLYRQRDWARLAGVVSSGGFLIYSAMFLLFALKTKEVNGHWLLPFGYSHLALGILWSLLVMPFCWLGGRPDGRDSE